MTINSTPQDFGRFIGTEHAVALILAATARASDAYPQILRSIGTPLGWQFGAVWEATPGSASALRCVELWCNDAERFEKFAQETRDLSLPRGVGLPGRVWESGRPAWITDVKQDSNFPRAHAAAETGLTAAFCFPLQSAHGVSGAIEFLVCEARAPDRELLATMETLGSQIGQFVERGRAEEAMRERETRYAGVLDSALDCIITIDERGNVLEFNRAAEGTFGYAASDVVGHQMAELIVPPALRERHRTGFARYLATGLAHVLGRRFEIVAMRADGSEFPVELTITEMHAPGPRIFTGFLRDITERKHADDELRASRQRLVEAEDTERRRLERNLHDGAQQRLVSVTLLIRLAREAAKQNTNELDDLLDRAAHELATGLDELRELARGIHPAILTDRGLGPALVALADRSAVPVQLEAALEGWIPELVQAAAYYVVSEALANVGKYARATAAHVNAAMVGGNLVVEVTDDGVGGADPSKGSGLRGLTDRVEALGGQLSVEVARTGGTRLRAEIPIS